MSVSTVPAVKARLVALLKEKVGAETEVWANRPNEDHQLAENIFVGAVRGERRPANIGSSKPVLEESYTVQVDVEVQRDGTDGTGGEERLNEIVAVVEAAVRENVTLSLGTGGGVQAALEGRFEQSSEGDSTGWLCRHSLQVTVTGRI